MSSWKELETMPLEERTKLKWNDPRIIDYVRTVEKERTLPTDSLRTLLYTENSYIDKDGQVKLNENNDSTTVSKSKARGIMQFTDATMKLMNNRWMHNALDPLENIWYAADYFSHTLNKQYNGNLVAAIADYNGGPKQAGNVLKNMMPESKQTADYLRKAQHHATGFEAEMEAARPKPAPKPTVAETPAGAVTGMVKPVDSKKERVLSYDANGRRVYLY